jgi:hypothetical protein
MFTIRPSSCATNAVEVLRETINNGLPMLYIGLLVRLPHSG